MALYVFKFDFRKLEEIFFLFIRRNKNDFPLTIFDDFYGFLMKTKCELRNTRTFEERQCRSAIFDYGLTRSGLWDRHAIIDMNEKTFKKLLSRCSCVRVHEFERSCYNSCARRLRWIWQFVESNLTTHATDLTVYSIHNFSSYLCVQEKSPATGLKR